MASSGWSKPGSKKTNRRRPVMRITIFTKIIAGFSILMILTITLGIYNLMQLNETIDRYSALLSKNQTLINTVRTMQVDFKKQVQEWKNILLRGHNPEDRQHYLQAFVDAYEAIQTQGTELHAILIQPDNQALLQQFLEAHQKVQRDYLAALKIFTASDGTDYQTTDEAVRGIDRAPTDLLDTLVDNIITDVQHDTVYIEEHTQHVERWSMALLVGIVLVGVGVSLIIARRLSKPISEIAAILQTVAAGKITGTVPMVSKQDEIGDLARATQQFMQYLRDVAHVAEKVADNDLQVTVTPKSDHDILNHSLGKMITNLRQMIAKNEQAMQNVEQQNALMKQQAWLKDGITQLSTELSGETSLLEVCRKAVSVIARYVNAGHGVLYAYDPDQDLLTLYGTFAFTERDEIANIYQLGEGVIGQVAWERKPILLKQLTPEDSLIKTGTAAATPLNTYTLPLIYEDQLYGVLELASFEPFDQITQELLIEANRVIATAMFSASQRERSQELLRRAEEATQEAERAKREAQRQAEELQQANVSLEEQQQQLQQQNEEFQQMNAQLEEQQQQLEQQREELRQQQQNLLRAQQDEDQQPTELEKSRR
ncbi:GAF domain-containing protein [candidate division KSB3 bacterium]|uniref:GAF domain-containing protein n=1 Tax=candidate division KSB3 bacterium TaxID=2044937 RepID=A0A9D5JZ38_9BACT|nr:GAF domain-containing protein [candidate division KSB3 bacterium]MBD3326411.1 GAF domain-containing protein [candidate division KSB3 bacterium]